MPYTQTTLDSLAIQIGVLLDDTSELYWTRQEKYYAIWEGLRVWGSMTNYWRARGAFNLVASPIPQPYYDLSVLLPALRPRTWTLDQLTQEIQFAILEAANGITGAGMSAQISVQSILNSIQRARNRFVQDATFPVNVHATGMQPPPPTGLIPFPQSSVFVHHAAWQDFPSTTWLNLWREDAWSADKAYPLWTIKPGAPSQYSESELAPLQIQVVPPPINEGNLEVITVDSLAIDLTNPASTFALPDEWVYALKWAALADLFAADSQMNDPVRAQYAMTRYTQAADATKDARSIVRLLINNKPVAIDSLAALDQAIWYWKNQIGPTQMAGVLYDFIAVAPTPDQAYGVTADVIQSAPIPTGSQHIQLGYEDIQHLVDYCIHILTFKCGGNEFKATFGGYDSFLHAVEGRGQINKAKIRYLTPLWGQVQKDSAEVPDRVQEPKSA